MGSNEEEKIRERCLYIVPNSPISPNYRGGGAAIYYEQLHSLAQLGVEIYLWHFCYDSRFAELENFILSEPDIWADVNAICTKVYRTQVPDIPTLAERVYNRSSNILTANEIRNPLVRGKCYSKFKEVLAEVEPDIIWAQHLVSAQISLLQKKVPVIYSHHDWLYKIKSTDPNQKWDPKTKKIEENIARKGTAVVSGSAIECKQLIDIGCSNVHYIPVAYKAATNVISKIGGKPRVVHLGGLGTTATRIGLERFFDVVWERLDKGSTDMWVVGDISDASDKMKKDLAMVTCAGFVKDLGDVLRPNDIHVIPWEYETGQRTRLVQAFNYGQAVVATKQSVMCFPEAIDGYNCLLVDSLDEMPRAIDALVENDEQRTRLSDNARATFKAHFTREVLLPKYKAVIDSIA